MAGKKKKNNTPSSEMKKCPLCKIRARPEDLPSHRKFKHETPHADAKAEFDSNGKEKQFFCASCIPPRGFTTQQGLDDHKTGKNH